MYKYNCEFCNETFDFKIRQQCGAHKRNCLKNPKRKEILEKIKKANPNQKQHKEIKCEKCGKKFEVLITKKNFLDGKYKKNCSLKCANSRKLSEESKNKISITLKNKPHKNGSLKEKEIRECISCKKKFECYKNSKKKCCNLSCAGSLGGKNSIQGLRSKNEILFSELCYKNFGKVSNNEKFFNGWDADIILHNEKVAVLWNGVWHYKKITKEHSLKQTKQRDKLKINEIKKMGYKPYIIKDMGKFNPNFVKKQFNLFLKKIQNRLVVAAEARQAHNLEVASSILAEATKSERDRIT